jgi:predicted PurR-regulated permease PerM
MPFDSIRTTNKILTIFLVVVALYVLKVLSFIFVPFMFAVFIALVFMPLMRWFYKRSWPRYLAMIAVIMIIVVGLYGAFKIIQLSGQEVMAGKNELYQKLDEKIGLAVAPYAKALGIKIDENKGIIKDVLQSREVNDLILRKIGPGLSLLQKGIGMILMTFFFLLLLLAGSINFKVVMTETLFKRPTQAIKVFMNIERSIVRFLVVKFFISLVTGLSFTIICWAFGISFPIFWGLLTFGLNFIQSLGSIFVTALTSLMAIIDIQHPGSMTASILLFVGIQVLLGSIIEPILMGKSFSINIVVVLVMLMFWGFLWGIAGLILAVPITVLLKILFEQYPHTKTLARLMS